MEDIYIVGAARTAIGKFGGTLGKTPAADLGAVCLRRIVDDGESVACRQRLDSVHVDGMTEQMHRDYRHSPFGYQGFRVLEVHVPGNRFRVDRHRYRARAARGISVR